MLPVTEALPLDICRPGHVSPKRRGDDRAQEHVRHRRAEDAPRDDLDELVPVRELSRDERHGAGEVLCEYGSRQQAPEAREADQWRRRPRRREFRTKVRAQRRGGGSEGHRQNDDDAETAHEDLELGLLARLQDRQRHRDYAKKQHAPPIQRARDVVLTCARARERCERRRALGEDERVGPERRAVVHEKHDAVARLQDGPAEDAAELADLKRAIADGRRFGTGGREPRGRRHRGAAAPERSYF
mmetsp:Transcript_2868/g.8496  ORF Transcript_2868/g.8496 Transcript_2868/m.8496 type:complete len:244 (-) Transcript_2868:1573-2304(-)